MEKNKYFTPLLLDMDTDDDISEQVSASKWGEGQDPVDGKSTDSKGVMDAQISIP